MDPIRDVRFRNLKRRILILRDGDSRLTKTLPDDDLVYYEDHDDNDDNDDGYDNNDNNDNIDDIKDSYNQVDSENERKMQRFKRSKVEGIVGHPLIGSPVSTPLSPTFLPTPFTHHLPPGPIAEASNGPTHHPLPSTTLNPLPHQPRGRSSRIREALQFHRGVSVNASNNDYYAGNNSNVNAMASLNNYSNGQGGMRRGNEEGRVPQPPIQPSNPPQASQGEPPLQGGGGGGERGEREREREGGGGVITEWLTKNERMGHGRGTQNANKKVMSQHRAMSTAGSDDARSSKRSWRGHVNPSQPYANQPDTNKYQQQQQQGLFPNRPASAASSWISKVSGGRRRVSPSVDLESILRGSYDEFETDADGAGNGRGGDENYDEFDNNPNGQSNNIYNDYNNNNNNNN
eukprot:CAMPEP_0175051508 /NCGR_PEP_ID=MMETSP0052_2-20121109/7846_1 /TAXON_ID=51329 ORGANISM="Polytomella parva, Strain SAG 63-3" /NCGR_SAMPLE_ID=MMETSP0052_2 /ASSEMBLY_ACC=CAM_ASM_000194 /LENGTH=402 /DNA_ID=CAMNT_0016315815 /DNA_START=262 /DNA_END=1467 /DNA_ORIENTATION=+